MAKINIPDVLMKVTKEKSELEYSGQNIKEILDKLTDDYPDMKGRLYEEDKIRRFINVYCDGEGIRFLSNLETEVNKGSVIAIIPSIAGG